MEALTELKNVPHSKLFRLQAHRWHTCSMRVVGCGWWPSSASAGTVGEQGAPVLSSLTARLLFHCTPIYSWGLIRTIVFKSCRHATTASYNVSKNYKVFGKSLSFVFCNDFGQEHKIHYFLFSSASRALVWSLVLNHFINFEWNQCKYCNSCMLITLTGEWYNNIVIAMSCLQSSVQVKRFARLLSLPLRTKPSLILENQVSCQSLCYHTHGSLPCLWHDWHWRGSLAPLTHRLLPLLCCSAHWYSPGFAT